MSFGKAKRNLEYGGGGGDGGDDGNENAIRGILGVTRSRSFTNNGITQPTLKRSRPINERTFEDDNDGERTNKKTHHADSVDGISVPPRSIGFNVNDGVGIDKGTSTPIASSKGVPPNAKNTYKQLYNVEEKEDSENPAIKMTNAVHAAKIERALEHVSLRATSIYSFVGMYCNELSYPPQIWNESSGT